MATSRPSEVSQIAHRITTYEEFSTVQKEGFTDQTDENEPYEIDISNND